MRLLRHVPAAPLASYVECFWWSERDIPQSCCEHMLPSGSAQLVFALHDAPIECRAGSVFTPPVIWSRGVLHGPQWKYYLAGPKPVGTVVGVSFRPGAAGAVLGVPASELADRHVPIEDLWGLWGRRLREQLQETATPAAQFQLLERCLTQRLGRPLLIHPAVAHALRGEQDRLLPQRVSDVQQASGYSARHFIDLFRSAVGLTPKHYFRVQRFAVVLRQLAARPHANLAEIAAMAGYSDQAHMGREFREFSGITPTQYRPVRPDAIFHFRR